MLAAIIGAALVGGISGLAGAGWHDEFPGADPVAGFHLHVGGRLSSESSPYRVSLILVLQGFTIPVENNDDEFPAQWRRQMFGIGFGARFDKGPFSALASIGAGITTNRFGPGGGNDAGTMLSATVGVALWKAFHLDATLSHWFVNANGRDIGATALAAGIGAWF